MTKDLETINLPNYNPVETQTAILFNYQIECHPDNIYLDIGLTSLLVQNLDSSIFTILRTEKQIG